MRKRRSSLRITLVLIGTAALSACDQGPRYTNRDMYASAEDCQKDWGRPEACQETTLGGQGTQPVRTWYGPTYASDSGSARGSRAIGVSSVSRGGFGSSAGFHSIGG
jgi:uncharacterized protein YgiB involved in biofilm formation